MKKNILKVLSIIVIISSFVGCNNNLNKVGNNKETQITTTSTEVAATVQIETTEAHTEVFTEAPKTEIPTEAPTEAPTEEPTEVITEEPTETPKEQEEDVKGVIENNEETNTYDYVDSAQGGVSGYYDEDVVYQVLSKVNEIRAEYGLSSLSWDNTLEDVAKVRAKEASVCWSHYRPDGTKYTTVCPTRVEGENLAKYYFDVDDVINAWMNSPTHKENILRAQFTSVGIACYKTDNGGCFWAQSFTTL